MPTGLRRDEPAKITSCVRVARRLEAFCSPKHHVKASSKVGFARPVRPHNRGHAGRELNFGFVGKGFEAVEGEAFQAHSDLQIPTYHKTGFQELTILVVWSILSVEDRKGLITVRHFLTALSFLRFLPTRLTILLSALFAVTSVYLVITLGPIVPMEKVTQADLPIARFVKKAYQSALLPPPFPIPAHLPPIVKEEPVSFRVTILPAEFEANAINNKGEVVGTWNAHAQTSFADQISNAAVWHQGKVRLFPRLDNTPQCSGVCLSDSGLVGGSAGHIYIDPFEDPSLAVVWDAKDKKFPIHSLGQLPKLSGATVLAVNTQGQAVGTSGSSCDGEMRDGTSEGIPYLGVIHAFLWDGQKMQDLGDGDACGINEGGQVVGTQDKKLCCGKTERSIFWATGKRISSIIVGKLSEPRTLGSKIRTPCCGKRAC